MYFIIFLCDNNKTKYILPYLNTSQHHLLKLKNMFYTLSRYTYAVHLDNLKKNTYRTCEKNAIEIDETENI